MSRTQSTPTAKFVSRGVSRVLQNVERSEGLGARVRRSIGDEQVDYLDPFLLLDHFRGAAPAGFPDHPHRGFQTVTYMLPGSQGAFQHEDFNGHRGVLRGGDVQWMVAGRGVVHCELPADERTAEGLQLWVNLPAAQKLCAPSYQYLQSEQFPGASREGVRARVIAGSALGVSSPLATVTPTLYVHFSMATGSALEQALPADWNAFVYVFRGAGGCTVGPEGTAGQLVLPFQTALLDTRGTGVRIRACKTGSTGSAASASAEAETVELVLVAGLPLREPVARRGVFVMNTAKELAQAFEDLRTCRNGFEKYSGWESASWTAFRVKYAEQLRALEAGDQDDGY